MTRVKKRKPVMTRKKRMRRLVSHGKPRQIAREIIRRLAASPRIIAKGQKMKCRIKL